MAEIDSIFQEVQEAQDKLAKMAREKGKEVVYELLKPLFEHPGVENVHWAQYTPYFNDGDPCVFSVHFEPWFNYDPDDGGYPEEQDGNQFVYAARDLAHPLNTKMPSWYTSEEAWQARLAEEIALRERAVDAGWTIDSAKRFNESLQEVRNTIGYRGPMADFFKMAFGDHVQVTVHADGSFDIDEYYHE